MRRLYKAVAVCLSAIFLGLAVQSSKTYWVGHTDLEVTFLVVDRESGHPVPCAVIAFRGDGGGFCKEVGKQANHAMETDKSGRLVRTWADCMCFGQKGLLASTFAIHLPALWFRASAPGYANSGWIGLDDRPHVGALKRGKSGATLIVEVALKRE